MLKYKTHADEKSLYNTPPAYGIYICGKVFKWLKDMGGLEKMKEMNEKKAQILYDFLDQSKLFKGTVEAKDRSLMNVPFVTGDADLDKKEKRICARMCAGAVLCPEDQYPSVDQSDGSDSEMESFARQRGVP